MPNLSLTGRDYTTELENLVDALQQELPEYTDYNHSSVGMAHLRLLARTVDQLNYFIDHVAQEGFLRTARFRQSLIDLGTVVGFIPKLSSPAMGYVVVTRVESLVGDIRIPRFTSFFTQEYIPYITTTSAIMYANSNEKRIPVIQGQINVQHFPKEQMQIIDWTGNYKINLGKGVTSYYLDVWEMGESEKIFWQYCDGLWRSGPEDRHYFWEVDGDTEDVYLVIGNGENGKAPPSTGLYVQYVVTQGAKGNTPKNKIVLTPSNYSNKITVNNPETISGGANLEHRDSIRRGIPRLTRTQRRGVTLDDYATLVERIPGIVHAIAIDREKEKEYPYHYVVIYAIPEGGGELPDQLIEEIKKVLADYGHLGGWMGRYIIKDVIQRPIDITVTAGLNLGYSEEDAKEQIQKAIQNVFDAEIRDIGMALTYSELYKAISKIEAISWFKIDPVIDTTIAYNEVATLNNLTIIIQ